jgi:dipeptidyl aminopeptidase/acylaminoacyl peptidase
LLEAGDNDGTVYWHQSVELYNIARRAKKNVVMLVYNGEDHGWRSARTRSTITAGFTRGSTTI